MTVFIQKERMYISYFFSLVFLYFFCSFMYNSEIPEPSRYLKYLNKDFNDLAWVISNILTTIGIAAFFSTLGVFRVLFIKNSELISLKGDTLYIPKLLTTKVSKVPVNTITNVEMQQHYMKIHCRIKEGELNFRIPRLLAKDLLTFYEHLSEAAEQSVSEPKPDRYAILLDKKKVSDIALITPMLVKLTKRSNKQILAEYQAGRVIIFRSLGKDNAVKVREKLAGAGVPITFIKEPKNVSKIIEYYTPETPHYMMPTAWLLGASCLGIDITLLVLIYLMYLFKHYKIDFDLMQLPLAAILFNSVLNAYFSDIDEPLSLMVYLVIIFAISAFIGLSLKKQLESKFKHFSANTFYVVLFGEIAINYYVNKYIFDGDHEQEGKISELSAT